MARRSARYRQLMQICRRRGCPLEDAREIVQEAHLRLFEYESHSRVRDVDSLLRRIVLNLSINFYHRKLENPPTLWSLEKADRAGCLVDPRSSIDGALVAEERLKEVADFVGAISMRTCQIFLLQRLGYSYTEIAAAYAIKPRTVEKHVTAAVEALSEHFSEAQALALAAGNATEAEEPFAQIRRSASRRVPAASRTGASEPPGPVPATRVRGVPKGLLAGGRAEEGTLLHGEIAQPFGRPRYLKGHPVAGARPGPRNQAIPSALPQGRHGR